MTHASRLNGYAQDMSCFDRLPLELKVEIFGQCTEGYARLRSSEGPLLLCGVCSSWREIVHSTPKLWATFAIEYLDVIDQGTIKLLDFWLERSRTSPLSFRISQHSRSDRVLTTLVRHVRHWSDVDLRVPSGSLASFRWRDARALRSLTLQTKGSRSRSPFNVQSLGVPWTQLTRLNLDLGSDHLLDLSECADVLSQATRLSECTLNADYSFGVSKHKLVLPSLVHLDLTLQRREPEHTRITDTPESCLASFLESFQLPRLNSLSLRWLLTQDGDGTQWSDVHPRFLSFLGSLAATLRSLTIAYLPMSDKQVLDCLTPLDGLSHLDLRFSLADKQNDPITDALLQTCTPPHECLPSLESIYFQCPGASHCTTRVIDLIQSRWHPADRDSVHLHSFSLVSMKPVSTQTRQKVERWLQEGLKVSIESVLMH